MEDVVLPALGIGASPSFVAGLYEAAPEDVPRIVAVPAWNAIGVFDGDRWLDSTALADGSISAYRQALDMRTGTARTSYEWVSGRRRTAVQVETFVSRAAPISPRSGSSWFPAGRGACACASPSPPGRPRRASPLPAWIAPSRAGARPTSGIRGG